MTPRILFSIAAITAGLAMAAPSLAAQGGAEDMNEAQISLIQSRLASLGFPPGAERGAWDGATASALESFQEFHGIETSGAPDDLTLRMLGVAASVEMAEDG
jgi:peptidoglycan hydrolase-like protein with peptidoglycan-binding domain